MGIFTKGISKMAYQGKLTCPHLVNEVTGKLDALGSKTCDSSAIRHIEDINQFRKRYRCRKCGGAFQYDISGAQENQNIYQNPYAAYRKGKIWRSIEYALQGRQLKGVVKS